MKFWRENGAIRFETGITMPLLVIFIVLYSRCSIQFFWASMGFLVFLQFLRIANVLVAINANKQKTDGLTRCTVIYRNSNNVNRHRHYIYSNKEEWKDRVTEDIGWSNVDLILDGHCVPVSWE